MNPFWARALAFLSLVLVLGGAGLALVGSLIPWAQITLFHNIDISLPGFFFVGGGLCLSIALLIFLGARRFPLLCAAGAIFILIQTHHAVRDLPRQVKHQVLGAQMALFPLNRLFDQFHINDVEVGGWRVPDNQLLGPGLAWTRLGGWILLAGAVTGFPSDTSLVWLLARTWRVRCRTCGTRWLRARHARFCPACGIPADISRPLPCPRCGAEPARTDQHCIACGTDLAVPNQFRYSPQ